MSVFLLLNLFTISFVDSQTTASSSGNLAFVSLPDGAPYFETSSFEPNQVSPNQECYVNCNDIHRGQVKDGIPSIDNPVFLAADADGQPDEREKVIGVVIDGQPRAYPYNILNWHEIVNDVFDGVHVSVTYCPLTGSGMLYHTDVIDNAELGTSGFLYENNLVFYDRNTDTEWSQMAGVALRGEKIGETLDYSTAVETTWEAWKKLHPDTVVLSEETGAIRDYDRYPYGNYRSDGSIYFPTTYNPSEEPYGLYHEKALAQIIQISGETLLLPFEELGKVGALNHEFKGENLFTAYHGHDALAITYSSMLNGSKLNFSPFADSTNSLSTALTLDLPIFTDDEGTIWNFNGLAISGPMTGEQLVMMPTYNAFWFAASTFFYDASILQIQGDQLIVSTITRTITTVSDGVTITTTTEVTDDNVGSTSVTDLTPEVQDVGFLSFSSFYILGFVILIAPYMIRRKKR